MNSLHSSAKKPKSKHVQNNVPSLFFILSSFKSGKGKKVSTTTLTTKSDTINTANGEEEETKEKNDDELNCDKVLQSIIEPFSPLTIQLPEDIAAEMNNDSTPSSADPLLSPETGWWVSPTYEEDYAQCFNIWDENDNANMNMTVNNNMNMNNVNNVNDNDNDI